MSEERDVPSLEGPYCYIGKSFKFDAAHTLVDHLGPCGRLHGHTWTIKVEVGGSVDPTTGMVMDFGTLAHMVRTYLGRLDHHDLNSVLETTQPTAEFLAHWLLRKLRPSLSTLRNLDMVGVSVQEGDGGWATARVALDA